MHYALRVVGISPTPHPLAALLHQHGAPLVEVPEGTWELLGRVRGGVGGEDAILKTIGSYPRLLKQWPTSVDHPLAEAVQRSYSQVLVAMLEAGADPNTMGRFDYPTLALATRRKDIGMVAALLKHGAQVNAIDKDGRTALDIAQKLRHTEGIEVLLRAGAKTSKELAGKTAGF